ncbi:putative multicopper oxidase, type 1 [Zymoseptoria tritici IPO323]|uniref:laccase n=1 Tax=Zymoseptoria tritici (strain CBS 115943 / IPO323) TaxID=336722 RepID=F9X5A1_ZYMTI|nr:putative multicopper oxidase, type 1 [Zymoseptoria tritici IPO323]EGP88992.1 putative multicopper oxidase, type 1 [Zymoseptoria tritici IPO323]
MKLLTSLAAIVSVSQAFVLPAERLSSELSTIEERQTADPECVHGPQTRRCWSGGYSVATDFDLKHPETTVTRSYTLTITNSTCNPDGNGERLCQLINGQYPGPTITADWGDLLSIKIINKLEDNGTAIHFHGVRQLNTCGADGVPGITQCPIAPGAEFTYLFRATQFGTSWYHSHFSNQYGDGVVGAMVFNGPATSNYDVDLGPYSLTDWYYATAFETSMQSMISLQTQGGPPKANNILINGTNKNAAGGGAYNEVTITKGKKYRLRLINMSVDQYMRVSLDGHKMTVMTSDFVPIKPYVTETLLIAIGQRYDVIITANQTAGSYFFRVDPAADCFAANDHFGRAIWTYSDVSPSTPPENPWPVPTTQCLEPSEMAPYWKQAVPSNSFSSDVTRLNVNITTGEFLPDPDTIVVWAIDDQNINVNWSRPTVSFVDEGDADYTPEMHVMHLQDEGKWNYYLIQQTGSAPPIPHPIHLHGHDFFVLGQGSTAWDGTATLNFATPPRRDTATVPGGGWLAIAFPSNNPGTWLLHCHIAFHIGEGLGMQFIEEAGKIVKPHGYDETCSSWRAYEKGMYYPKHDSGL